jgi:hypothetical protein
MTSNPIKRIACVTGKLLFGGFLAASVASCGGGGGSPGTLAGNSGTTVGSISLIFSSSELKSAGTPGSEVAVTALIKTASNTAVADIPVKFSADSGALTGVDTVSDKNGQAKASLGTSGDRTNRKITVTAEAGGKSASGSVDVVGTSVTLVGPNTISAGGSGDFTITLKDSSNVAIPNVPVTFSSQKGNTIVVKASNGGAATAPLTNSQGQVILTVSATQSGNDTLSVSSQGTSTSLAVAINASKLTLAIVDASGNPASTANTTSSCQKVIAHYEVAGVLQNGTVNINTSRGKLYSNSGCTTLMASSSVALVGGDSSPAYLKSDTAGVSTVTASIPSGPSAQANIEFVAALTSSATISLQADPGIIGANTGSGQSEKSTLTAIVRDGTTNNNFVKDAVVEFSILSDKSGGSLSDPSVVKTASNGTASTIFIAGTADTPRDGVVIQAKIQGTNTTTTTTLTVARKSLFITAGTGNTLTSSSNTTYQQDYTVVVNDASGNPVPNVTITAAVFPTRYRKGYYTYDAVTAKSWARTIAGTCLNEDVNKDGVLDAGEDSNGNGILDPGIPVAVTTSATTDANGLAKVSLIYPRDRGGWIEIQLTIRGSVSGTESTYQTPAYFLPLLATDLTDQTTPPPGVMSPYGVNACNLSN